MGASSTRQPVLGEYGRSAGMPGPAVQRPPVSPHHGEQSRRDTTTLLEPRLGNRYGGRRRPADRPWSRFRLMRPRRAGAALTVGSMLRTDKVADYPVSFRRSRETRGGGNVWQHLRTFRKRLFGQIRGEDLKVGDRWIPEAEDWAYMLPMAENAQSPVRIVTRTTGTNRRRGRRSVTRRS